MEKLVKLSLRRAEEEACNLAPITGHFLKFLNVFPQTGLLCKQDWSSEFLASLNHVAQAGLHLSQQDPVGTYKSVGDTAEKATRGYTATGSLEALWVPI